MDYKLMYLKADDSPTKESHFFIEVEPDRFLEVTDEPENIRSGKDFISKLHQEERETKVYHMRLTIQELRRVGAYVIAGN